MVAGRAHPVEHAGSCTCPCPWCDVLHRQHLHDAGLFERDAVRFKFLYALGHRRVTEELAGGEWGPSAMKLYLDITRNHDVREREPVATYGWLVDNGDGLRVVRTLSDPWREKVDHALEEWAAQNGKRLKISHAELERAGETRDSRSA